MTDWHRWLWSAIVSTVVNCIYFSMHRNKYDIDHQSCEFEQRLLVIEGDTPYWMSSAQARVWNSFSLWAFSLSVWNLMWFLAWNLALSAYMILLLLKLCSFVCTDSTRAGENRKIYSAFQCDGSPVFGAARCRPSYRWWTGYLSFSNSFPRCGYTSADFYEE